MSDLGPLFEEPWAYLGHDEGHVLLYRSRGREIEVYHEDEGWEPVELPAVQAVLATEFAELATVKAMMEEGE